MLVFVYILFTLRANLLCVLVCVCVYVDIKQIYIIFHGLGALSLECCQNNTLCTANAAFLCIFSYLLAWCVACSCSVCQKKRDCRIQIEQKQLEKKYRTVNEPNFLFSKRNMFMMIINFIAYEYYFAVTAEFMERKEQAEENKSERSVCISRCQNEWCRSKAPSNVCASGQQIDFVWSEPFFFISLIATIIMKYTSDNNFSTNF